MFLDRELPSRLLPREQTIPSENTQPETATELEDWPTKVEQSLGISGYIFVHIFVNRPLKLLYSCSHLEMCSINTHYVYRALLDFYIITDDVIRVNMDYSCDMVIK